jgi:hypothetical protein
MFFINATIMTEKQPPFRKLRGYAFDPSMSLEIDTAPINEILYKVPWEKSLDKGPEGEYIKVLDWDPSSGAVYDPVDLNDQFILANDGLEPSESNPKFHQQMVYAVTMNTIKNFEKAIGRKVQWSPSITEKKVAGRSKRIWSHVPKLVLYPHAFRGANAYYSPDRKAILFGYFNAMPASVDLHMPGSIVYSCLSHDIIAHEVTHAILDGMFSRFMEPTHPDVAAFHEAFADIVALFQHFTFPDVITHEIARIRGQFNAENLLGKLAVEFGKASGSHKSLRDGIGEEDKKTNEWKRKKPDISSYRTEFECHDRGSILVAAVFDAFITIYNKRASDVIKIATGGTGVLPDGDLNTYLITDLANEASKAAAHVLNMCIRALDYCPPMDITFGDYLRALITADAELVKDDKYNYRLAFIDAFRKRGIYPDGISNLSVESLVYSGDDSPLMDEIMWTGDLRNFIENFKNEMSYEEDRERIFNNTRSFITGDKTKSELKNYKPKIGFHKFLIDMVRGNYKNELQFEKRMGLVFSDHYPDLDIHPSPTYRSIPSIEVHDIRLNNRVGPDGNIQNQVIIMLAQSCGVKVKYDEKKSEYDIKTFLRNKSKNYTDGSFVFRGGCTLVFDLNTNCLQHVIPKPIIDMELLNRRKPVYKPNRSRAIMQYRCQCGDYADITGIRAMMRQAEYLSHIHQPKLNNNEQY